MINREIFEINGKKTFMKAKANAFEIGKVLLSFVEFDEKTKKSVKNIDIYMDVSEMLVFCNDVLSGRLVKMAQDKAKDNPKFPPAVFSNQGGTKSEKAGRADGKALARVLNFGASSRAGNFVFQALSGPGKELEQGLISMEDIKNPEKRIIVPCSANDLKKLCLMVKSDYQAYLSGQYSKNAFEFERFERRQ